jgi:hypothetical protein
VNEETLADLVARLAGHVRALPITELARRMRAAPSDGDARAILDAAVDQVLREAFRDESLC